MGVCRREDGGGGHVKGFPVTGGTDRESSPVRAARSLPMLGTWLAVATVDATPVNAVSVVAGLGTALGAKLGRTAAMPLVGVSERCGTVLGRTAAMPLAGVSERCGTVLGRTAAMPLAGVSERCGTVLGRTAAMPLVGLSERFGGELGRAVEGEFPAAPGAGGAFSATTALGWNFADCTNEATENGCSLPESTPPHSSSMSSVAGVDD
jgi:hypothetical protein